MQIKLRRYRNNIDTFKNHLARSTGDIKRAINEYSTSYHIPILVCYSFANEILNTNEYDEDIKKLMKFYNIEKVVE